MMVRAVSRTSAWLGIACFALSASPLLSGELAVTTAHIDYNKSAVPVKPNDCIELFNQLEGLLKKDPFESTAARNLRFSTAPLYKAVLRILVASERVEIVPYPDENVYLVALNGSSSPLVNQPAIITVWSATVGRHEVTLQNAFGATVNGAELTIHEIKLAVVNWNSLSRGLVWNTNKENPQSGSAQMGVPFKAPDTELLSLMKLGKLSIWIRAQPTDLKQASIENHFYEATFSAPVSLSKTEITIPVEILAIGVVSENATTAYALWSRERQSVFEELSRRAK